MRAGLAGARFPTSPRKAVSSAIICFGDVEGDVFCIGRRRLLHGQRLVIEMQPHMTMPIHRTHCDAIGGPLDQKT